MQKKNQITVDHVFIQYVVKKQNIAKYWYFKAKSNETNQQLVTTLSKNAFGYFCDVFPQNKYELYLQKEKQITVDHDFIQYIVKIQNIAKYWYLRPNPMKRTNS